MTELCPMRLIYHCRTLGTLK